jgi:hypothetical protein
MTVMAGKKPDKELMVISTATGRINRREYGIIVALVLRLNLGRSFHLAYQPER